VLDHVGPAAVNLHPREGFLDHVAVQQPALRAERRAQIHEPRLQREDLMEPLHVASRDREHAQLHTAFERIR